MKSGFDAQITYNAEKKIHVTLGLRLSFHVWPSYIRPRDNFLCAPSQWETTLQCNVVSHWLGACWEWSVWALTQTMRERVKHPPHKGAHKSIRAGSQDPELVAQCATTGPVLHYPHRQEKVSIWKWSKKTQLTCFQKWVAEALRCHIIRQGHFGMGRTRHRRSIGRILKKEQQK